MTGSRPPSPYLELKPTARPGTTEPHQLNHQLIQNREKIHRIRPRTNFFAEITYVTSPSEIWIRPCNHISDKLTIPFNQSLELETNLKENVYVMTPLNEDILVRARIILFDNSKQKYLLRLIDHGKPVWRNANDIYEMKFKNDEIRKYPWQAIPIVLQGIEPENGKEWTEAEVYFITNALSEFSSYFVMPTFHDAFVINNDAKYLRASINGLNETEMKLFRSYKSREKDLLKTVGFSIAEYYRILSTSNEASFYLPRNEPEMDFFKQQSFSYPLKYDDIDETKYQAFNNSSSCFTASDNDSSDSGSSKAESNQFVDVDSISSIKSIRSASSCSDYFIVTRKNIGL
uniref:Tudor domain-containing protein n=1 Tax=Panagrolaimus sp. PS1159 TaxID=55785 RepID=A0AC35GI29_9BILA